MKYKKILSLIAISAASLFTIELFAQATQDTPISKFEYKQADSLKAIYERDQAQTQKAEDVEKMTDAKNEQSETKAKAKEAQRIEEEADDAAKQSKNALKSEKKAQKQRKQADKQAEKAETARDKSDLN